MVRTPNTARLFQSYHESIIPVRRYRPAVLHGAPVENQLVVIPDSDRLS